MKKAGVEMSANGICRVRSARGPDGPGHLLAKMRPGRNECGQMAGWDALVWSWLDVVLLATLKQ